MPVDNPAGTPGVAPNRGPIAPPKGRPAPILNQNNISSVQDLNDKVQAAVDAHVQATGVKPSPALVFDLVRSPIGRDQYADMFRYPTLSSAKTASLVGTNPPVDPEKAVIAQLNAVKTRDDFNTILNEHEDVIHSMLDQGDTKLLGAYRRAQTRSYQNQIVQTVAGVNRNFASLTQPGTALSVFERVAADGLRATNQIGTGLALGLPTLAIAEGRAVKGAVGQRSLRPIGKENVKLGEGVVKGVKQDFSNPEQNAGNLILDVFGLASLGAGAYTRALRANAAVLDEGGALTGAKVAARRPVGGTAPLVKNGFAENQLLTENPLVRPLQRVLVAERNARMARRGVPDPGGALSINLGTRVQNALDLALDPLRANFSSENKLGREARVRRRIELQIQMGVKRDLDRVAGWAQTATKAYQRIAQRGIHPRSLSVGEQKAIDVLSLDDPTPLETWRKFHQNMLDLGVGDPAAHRAQLAALKLAGKALEDPSPRLQRALALTREVVAEQERIKAQELGLQVETANRRVIGEGEFVRQQAEALNKEEALSLIPKPGRLGEGPKLSETSQYLPRSRRGKPRRGVSENLELFSPQAGKYGVPEPVLPQSLRHEYSGSAIQAGDFRIDSTALAGEEYARVVRAASKLNEWRKLRDTGVERPPDLRWYRPIRKGTAVDDKLREIVDRTLDAELSSDDAQTLSEVEARNLERYLYPAEMRNGQWHLLPDVSPDDVLWNDVRLLDRYRPPAPKGMKTFFQVANEPFRDVTLFYRLAYALNAVGNAGMATIAYGTTWVPNLLRAVHSEGLYGAKAARALETLAGTSRSASYAPVGVGEGIAKTLTAPGRVMARAWNVVTDQKFREAAIVQELRRQARELKMDPNAPETINRLLFDKQFEKQRNEAVRRGNKAMVEFDNQTWFEREYLRHFVFVYPWQSRSFVWTLRTLVEHPVEAAVLNQIGREADQEFPEVMKRVPEWLKRIGYVPVGFNSDGSPKLVNPSSVNTFTTLNQMMYPFASGFGNVKYASAADLLGPAATFVVHGVTGKDEFGNDYPNGDWVGAAEEVLVQLPQLRPSNRKQNTPLPPVDLSDRETLVHRLNAGLKQTVFSPGWLGGYGQLISGGLTRKTLNPDAAEARYYRDLPLAQRHKLEAQLVNRAMTMQADLLKQKLPGDVKDAVNLGLAFDLVYKQQAKQLGRDLTDKERAQFAIQVLSQQAKISEPDATLLQKKLAKITDPADLNRFQAGLMDTYAGAKALRQWDADVRFVWSFRPEVLQPKLAQLKQQGLIDSAALPKDQETLFDWGRQALTYRQQARERAQQIAAAKGTTDEPLLKAQYRAWIDQQDKPVRVGGRSLPSPVRIAWANETPQAQTDHVAAVAKASWGDLSNFDKELVGRKVPASTSQAWTEMEQAVTSYKQQYPGAHIQRDQLDALAKEINRDPRYTGFLQDYIYSRQPLIRRFEQTSVYRTMPDLAVFNRIVGNDARKAAQALASGNYDNGKVTGAWGKYVETEAWPKLQEDKKLAAFLGPYGISFVKGLISR